MEPPVIFAANHSSHLDAPLVLTSLPERWRAKTAVGAASDYFFDVWWRSAATALAFNAFPVERKGPRRSTGTALALLDEGCSILVFPQGTRSHDGWIGDFHAGAAFLALRAAVPVIPVAIGGTFRAMPRGRAWPAPGRPPVCVRFAPPVHPRPRERARELNGRIQRALEVALHEDATTWWEAISADARDELPSYSGPAAARWRRIWEASRPPVTGTPRRAWERR
jgi:1-acyl-sn-glycerol-3-phosphate acyltransferase